MENKSVTESYRMKVIDWWNYLLLLVIYTQIQKIHQEYTCLGFFNEIIYISIRIKVGMDDILHVQNNVKNNNLDLKSTPWTYRLF